MMTISYFMRELFSAEKPWETKWQNRDVCRFRGTGITRKAASKRKKKK